MLLQIIQLILSTLNEIQNVLQNNFSTLCGLVLFLWLIYMHHGATQETCSWTAGFYIMPYWRTQPVYPPPECVCLCVKIRGMRRFIFSCIWLIRQEIERRRSLNTWGTSTGCENEPVKYGNMLICTAGEWIITASTAPQNILKLF